MNRDEYIKQLESNLLSLTEDEKAEAVQYYSDYFDEANDDQKVIEELGSPEELAKTITEKFVLNVMMNLKKLMKAKLKLNISGYANVVERSLTQKKRQ